MSEVVQHEEQDTAVALDADSLSEICNNVEPLSSAELALFAGLVTLPQAIAPQAAFDSSMRQRDTAYARPGFESAVQPAEPAMKGGHTLSTFTSSMQAAEPAINGAERQYQSAFASSVQRNEPTFQNGTIQ